MYKIYIDSSDRYNKTVRIIESNNSVEKVLLEHTNVSDIASTIQSILNQLNLKPQDIDLFESNPGPGSFTGLKIGTTIENVLNWALGKKRLNELKLPTYGKEPNINLKIKDFKKI